jgi:hypothetical protein
VVGHSFLIVVTPYGLMILIDAPGLVFVLMGVCSQDGLRRVVVHGQNVGANPTIINNTDSPDISQLCICQALCASQLRHFSYHYPVVSDFTLEPLALLINTTAMQSGNNDNKEKLPSFSSTALKRNTTNNIIINNDSINDDCTLFSYTNGNTRLMKADNNEFENLRKSIQCATLKRLDKLIIIRDDYSTKCKQILIGAINEHGNAESVAILESTDAYYALLQATAHSNNALITDICDARRLMKQLTPLNTTIAPSMHHVYPRCTQASQLDSDTISYDGEVRPRKAIINKNSIWSSKALRVACGKLNNLREIYDRSCTRSVDSDIKYGRRVELLMDSLLGTLLCILYFGALAQCWLIEET